MFGQSFIEVTQTYLRLVEKVSVPLDDSSVGKSNIGCDRLAHGVLLKLDRVSGAKAIVASHLRSGEFTGRKL